jgi:drug/metabolite transporter (DMT)-like permease
MIPQSGILFALLSAALFGASTPLAKALLGEISPWLLAGLLYLGSGSWGRCGGCAAALRASPR